MRITNRDVLNEITAVFSGEKNVEDVYALFPEMQDAVMNFCTTSYRRCNPQHELYFTDDNCVDILVQLSNNKFQYMKDMNLPYNNTKSRHILNYLVDENMVVTKNGAKSRMFKRTSKGDSWLQKHMK